MKEAELLMLDGCTKSEAEKHLERGTQILEESDFSKHFDTYMQEWDIDEGEQEKYREMLDTKEPLADWGVVEQDGKYFFIMYVL